MASDVKASTRAYENWLRNALSGGLVEDDLVEKHRKMREGAFPFLRATYWRWAETILDIRPDLARAAPVLAIGDTHVENFGCWRDVEGRLVWGANDFDDAAVMPWPLDPVRLAASALLARGEGGIGAEAICDAILKGYAAGVKDPGPVILERDHRWLREAVELPEKERAKYWDKFAKPRPEPIDAGYAEILRRSLPDPTGAFEVFPRQAGVGSLGRPRFVARSEWRGGPVLREAKVVVVSAWVLRHGGDRAVRIADIAAGPRRAIDPHYRRINDVVVRRLSPNSRKIEAEESVETLLSPDMLRAMGREVASCQVGDRVAVAADLKALSPDWLREAARAVARQVEDDWKRFTG